MCKRQGTVVSVDIPKKNCNGGNDDLSKQFKF